MYMRGCLRIGYYASWQNFAGMGSPANLAITERTGSKFFARTQSQSRNIFDLDCTLRVISGNGEPRPQWYGEFVYSKVLCITLNIINFVLARSPEKCI